MQQLIDISRRITVGFPFIALLFCALAFYRPEPFTAMKPGIVPLLGVVMFGMGMTLKVEDFRRVFERPSLIGLGILLQYGLMPLIAWAVATLLGLPP